jgi:hypothetical protein
MIDADYPQSALIAYSVFAFGVAYVLGKSVISRRAREILHDWRLTRGLVLLVECPACCGFWIGLCCGFWLYSAWRVALFLAFFTTATNYFLGRMTGTMEK